MTLGELATAQRDLRWAYRSASVGQIYSGIVWLTSAVLWMTVGTTAGVVALLVAGFFIYPVTAGISRLMGNPGTVSADNPLREASVTIPMTGVMGIPVAGAAALYQIEWFFPAFMVIIGAHYLLFSHLYGMRMFLPLGASMWFGGVSLGVWAPDLAVLGALFTGVALILVGAIAWHQHRAEFEGSPRQ